MKTIFYRRALAVLLGLALLLGALSVTGCSKKATPLLVLDGQSISVNQYQFLLARVKGSLAQNGYSVNSSSFWDVIVDSNGVTYDEYFRQAVLTDARRYLAALAIFEEEGMSLSKSDLDAIDEDIEEYIRDAGSKSALNATLATYGINVDMLRELYVIEAKYAYVQNFIYGTDGSLIGAQPRLDYLKEHAVCFRQVLIRSFDYVYDTDTNGDVIYYQPSENNARVNNIAYDTVNGNTRLDEKGKNIVDKNGDDVYYLPNGKIAYDKVNGVRAITYDKDGNAKVVQYSAEELAAHKEAAEEIMADVAKGDYGSFESLLASYENGNDDAFVTDGDYCFLYTTGDNSYDYLNDIADALAEADEGEIRIIPSEYGYNVVMKYPIPEDAVTNTAYEDWFTDLVTRVKAKLFHEKCTPYMDRVTVDEKAFSALPSMKDIGANYYY